jgi:hypothetical protein
VLFLLPFNEELLLTWSSVPIQPVEEDKGRRGSKSLFWRKDKDKDKDGHARNSSLSTTARTSVDGLRPPTLNSRSSSPSSDEGRPSLGARTRDPVAFPRRILALVSRYIDTNIPPTLPLENEDYTVALPPIFLLIGASVANSPEMATYIRAALFPPDLDRSPEAGALETRPGLLGTVLRFLNPPESFHLVRDAVETMLTQVFNSDCEWTTFWSYV